jgi:hypothetical protein
MMILSRQRASRGEMLPKYILKGVSNMAAETKLTVETKIEDESSSRSRSGLRVKTGIRAGEYATDRERTSGNGMIAMVE